MTTFSLRIENMHCGSCIRNVLKALNEIPNTHTEQVLLGSARVTTDASPTTVQQTLEAAGYPTVIASHPS